MSSFRQLHPSYIRLEKYNANANNVFEPVTFELAFNRPILTHSDMYSLVVNRVRLPVSKLEVYRLMDNSNYAIETELRPTNTERMVSSEWVNVGWPKAASGIAYMHTSENVGQTWLSYKKMAVYDDDVDESEEQAQLALGFEPMYSIRQVLENINRTIARSHLTAMYNQQMLNVYDKPFAKTFETMMTDQGDNAGAYTFEYPIKIGPFDDSNNLLVHDGETIPFGFVAGIMVYIQELKVISNAGGVEQNAAFDLVLISPSFKRENEDTFTTTENIIYTTTISDNYGASSAYETDQLQHVVFSEGAIKSGLSLNRASRVHLQPTTSFFAHASTPVVYKTDDGYNNEWVLQVRIRGFAMQNVEAGHEDEFLAGNFQVSLKGRLFVFPNYNFLPTVCPAFGLNSSGNLTMMAQQAFYTSGSILGMSSKVKQMINMGDSNYVPRGVPVNGLELYCLKLPNVVMHAGSDTYTYYDWHVASSLVSKSAPDPFKLVTLVSEKGSDQGNLTNITSIEIKAPSLPVRTETKIGNIESFSVMSLAIASSDVFDTPLIYNFDTTKAPFKQFPIDTPNNITHLNMQVWVAYRDGTETLLHIGPGELAEIFISFVSKDRI